MRWESKRRVARLQRRALEPVKTNLGPRSRTPGQPSRRLNHSASRPSHEFAISTHPTRGPTSSNPPLIRPLMMLCRARGRGAGPRLGCQSERIESDGVEWVNQIRARETRVGCEAELESALHFGQITQLIRAASSRHHWGGEEPRSPRRETTRSRTPIGIGSALAH